jgi:hypothetical protein
MVELVFIVCLLAQPSECQRIQPAFIGPMSVVACRRDGMFYAVRWLERHPLGNEMQRWVLVTEEEEVVGHLAATPQYYRINGERVVAHTPADYQVLPKYGFQALLLMRKFFRSTENCVAVDMLPSVIAVETRLGAEEAGGMQYAAKLLNVCVGANMASPFRAHRTVGCAVRDGGG